MSAGISEALWRQSAYLLSAMSGWISGIFQPHIRSLVCCLSARLLYQKRSESQHFFLLAEYGRGNVWSRHQRCGAVLWFLMAVAGPSRPLSQSQSESSGNRMQGFRSSSSPLEPFVKDLLEGRKMIFHALVVRGVSRVTLAIYGFRPGGLPLCIGNKRFNSWSIKNSQKRLHPSRSSWFPVFPDRELQ